MVDWLRQDKDGWLYGHCGSLSKVGAIENNSGKATHGTLYAAAGAGRAFVCEMQKYRDAVYAQIRRTGVQGL